MIFAILQTSLSAKDLGHIYHISLSAKPGAHLSIFITFYQKQALCLSQEPFVTFCEL